MNDLITNPYGDKTQAVVPQTAQTDVETQRAMAEVQAAMILAKKFPRDVVECTDKILNECQRQGLAEVALYTYNKGGTDITGPSIRLAEAIARNWRNLDCGVKELSQSGGESEMMSYAWDMENNVRYTKVFHVKHERSTKKGRYKLEDPRDVYEINANQAARRLRAAILAVIPGDVVEAAVSQCEGTLKSKADTSPEAVKKMVEAFGKFGVSKEQIEKRIQRRLDSITPAQVISLRKVYNSLKDAMSTPSDWFDTIEPEQSTPPASGAGKLKDALKSNRQPKQKESDIKEEVSPLPCPGDPKGTMTLDNPLASYCNECGSRDDCTAWPPSE